MRATTKTKVSLWTPSYSSANRHCYSSPINTAAVTADPGKGTYQNMTVWGPERSSLMFQRQSSMALGLIWVGGPGQAFGREKLN